MELKRILARDSKSAHEQAVARFGRDALIISTAQVEGQTELIIAIDGDGLGPYDSLRSLPDEAPAKTPASEQEGFQPFKAAMEVVLRHQAALASTSASTSTSTSTCAPAPAPAPAQASAPIALSAPASQPMPISMPASVAAGQGPEASAGLRSREIVDLIRAEIADLRQEIQSVKTPASSVGRRRFSRAVQPIANAVRRQCSDSLLSAALLNALTQAEDATEAVRVLRQGLVERLPAAVETHWSGVHALFGRSGVGKTLMAAKLLAGAARALPPERMAWVTFGESRPGAWSQAQMLASLIGLELFRARDLPTLSLLLDELSDRALVIIDTPGTETKPLAESFANLSESLGLHLVIPADACAGSVRRLIQQSGIRWRSALLSKVDEVDHPWQLVDLLSAVQGIGVAAVCAGHRLSDPLQPFQSDKLLESALSSLDEAVEAAAARLIPSPLQSPETISAHVHG